MAKYRPNTSAPVIEVATLAASGQHSEGPPSTIIARNGPTSLDHGVFFTVQVKTGSGSHFTTHNVKSDDILQWVSLDELTRFEHNQSLEEQRLKNHKALLKRQRRSRLHPATIQPLGSTEETEDSTTEDADDEFKPQQLSLTSNNKPRGRPRKHPSSTPTTLHQSLANGREPLISSTPTFTPRKRPREVEELRQLPNKPGSTSQHPSRRAVPNFEHVALPQIKKRLAKGVQNDPRAQLGAIGRQPPSATVSAMGQLPHQTVTSDSSNSFPSSQSSASEPSERAEMIYNPVIAYSDPDDIEEVPSYQKRPGSSKRPKVASPSSHASKTSYNSLNDDNQGHISHADGIEDDPMADISSADELAALHAQFRATPRNRLKGQLTEDPRTAFRASKQSFNQPPALSNASSSSDTDKLEIPIGGREASMDLGAPSSSQDSMRQTPVRLQRRPFFGGPVESFVNDISSDSMVASPVHLQRRLQGPLPPGPNDEIIEISSNDATNPSADEHYTTIGQDPTMNGGLDPRGTAKRNVKMDEHKPDIPSNQSFQGYESSASSDESTNDVAQSSNAKQTKRRAHRQISESHNAEATFNGRPTPDPSRRRLGTPRFNQTPIQRSFAIPIQSTSQVTETMPNKTKSTRTIKDTQLPRSTTPSRQQTPRSPASVFNQPTSVRSSNPFRAFSEHQPPSAQADSLASMGAGEPFPKPIAPKQHQSLTSASEPHPNTELNQYGKPLPLHPPAPPAAVNSAASSKTNTQSNSNCNSADSKSRSRKKQRQSMTPLFPRAAIIPDLTPHDKSPNKKKPLILSTLQFQP